MTPEQFALEQNKYNQTKSADESSMSDYVTLIKTTLPSGQTDQPSETKKLEERVKEYMKRGLTPQEAAMDYNGLRLDPSVDKTKALALYGAIKTLAKPIKGSESEVSRRLNNGDYAGAERYVKKQIDTDVKANY
jgi:hypothetical protein